MQYRIKDWDTMVNEYGINKAGCIPIDAMFVPEMQHLCGKFIYITEFPHIIDDGCETWTITPQMCERVVNKTESFKCKCKKAIDIL